ncbi:MAG: CvpA family protein, partial [Fibrobacteres bacterium]|nr:CvpA family protein [Fibrobacterota bacterium]
DVSILAIVVASVLWGVKKGVLSTLVSFLVLAVSLYASGYVVKSWAHLLPGGNVIHGVLFLLLFLIAFLLLTLLIRLLKFFGEITVTGFADIAGGVVLGLLRGIIICLILIFCALLIRLDRTEVMQNSILAQKVVAPVKRIVSTPPDHLKERIQNEVKEITD